MPPATYRRKGVVERATSCSARRKSRGPRRLRRREIDHQRGVANRPRAARYRTPLKHESAAKAPRLLLVQLSQSRALPCGRSSRYRFCRLGRFPSTGRREWYVTRSFRRLRSSAATCLAGVASPLSPRTCGVPYPSRWRGSAWSFPSPIPDITTSTHLRCASRSTRAGSRLLSPGRRLPGFSNTDVVCVQHEFGIYGGAAGSHLLLLLRGLRMPVVTTLHTVLAEPNPTSGA